MKLAKFYGWLLISIYLFANGFVMFMVGLENNPALVFYSREYYMITGVVLCVGAFGLLIHAFEYAPFQNRTVVVHGSESALYEGEHNSER